MGNLAQLDYTKLRAETWYLEPGNGWFAGLTRKDQPKSYSLTDSLDRVLLKDDPKNNLTWVSADELRSQCEVMWEHIKTLSTSGAKIEQTTVDNYAALKTLIGCFYRLLTPEHLIKPRTHISQFFE